MQPDRALIAQRTVLLILLVLFVAVFVGLLGVVAADPSAVLLPPILAGLVGAVGSALLLAAYAGDRPAAQALRLATIARLVLIAGAIAVVGLGAILAATLADGSVALIGVGAAIGPALASMVASTALRRFAAGAAEPGR
jgi:hypothetical protein